MFSTYRVSSRLSRYLSCSKTARIISPQIHSISSSQENRKFSVVSRTGFSPVTNNSFITTCCKMSSSNQPQFSANFLFRQVKFELFFMSMIDIFTYRLKICFVWKWCVWMCFMHVYEYILKYVHISWRNWLCWRKVWKSGGARSKARSFDEQVLLIYLTKSGCVSTCTSPPVPPALTADMYSFNMHGTPRFWQIS